MARLARQSPMIRTAVAIVARSRDVILYDALGVAILCLATMGLLHLPL